MYYPILWLVITDETIQSVYITKTFPTININNGLIVSPLVNLPFLAYDEKGREKNRIVGREGENGGLTSQCVPSCVHKNVPKSALSRFVCWKIRAISSEVSIYLLYSFRNNYLSQSQKFVEIIRQWISSRKWPNPLSSYSSGLRLS